jgi:hypothetical protein
MNLIETRNKKMTKNELQEWDAKSIAGEISNTQDLCKQLMRTPHYAKMGETGIFAIIQKAKALNINPIDALNGGLYCVNGKVEMSSNMMMQLIRQAGHSVTKDRKSDDTICILHGKRKDNGDTWTESFSIEDAQRAGIYKNVWQKFPRNMLFARALSNLARQLFADTVKGCYVENEIQGDLIASVESKEDETIYPSREEADALRSRLNQLSDLNKNVEKFMSSQFGTIDLASIPMEMFEKIKERVETAEEELDDQELSTLDTEEEENVIVQELF